MPAEDLYARACEAVERGNFPYAVKLFREVLRLNSKYPDARAAMRMSERKRLEASKGAGRTAMLPLRALLTAIRAAVAGAAKKLETYEDLLEDYPDSFWALCGAADAAKKAGLPEEAVSVYKDALRFKPEHARTLRVLSDTLREVGNTSEALKYLSRLSQMQPTNRDLADEVRNLEASDHMAAHRLEQAGSFRDMIRDKDEAARLEDSHRMSVTMDDLRKELVRLEQELTENPKQVNRILRLAQLYADVGELRKALEFLTEKQQLLPDSYEIREKLGDVAILIADKEVAAVTAKLEQNPKDAAAAKRLEDLRKRRREYALKEFRWRIAEHPTDRALQLRMGQLQFEMGDYNQAISSFQVVAQDARFALQAARMLGRCFMQKGQNDLALDQFARAIEAHPDMDAEGKDLHYLQAQAYEKTGKREDALKVYKRIYTEDINFRDVAQKVDALNA